MLIESNRFQRGAPERARLRVLNPTEGTVVTPDVVEMDTTRETFAAVALRLKEIANSGIWLNPYRGIPKVSWMPDLDIVYLDEQFQVLRCIEGFRQSTMTLPEMTASSAVVIPAGRLSAARIQFGDQLELHDAVTGARWQAQPAISETAVPSAEESDEGQLKPEGLARGLKLFFASLFGLEEEKPRERSSDRRKEKRHMIPGSVAYFSIGSPRPQEVANISTEGFYVRTADRWSEGTSLLVGLQIINPLSKEVEAMISVQSKVVRTGTDGVGFVYDDEPAHRNPILAAANPEQYVQLQKFMQRIQRG
jgi:hypothetical protein